MSMGFIEIEINEQHTPRFREFRRRWTKLEPPRQILNLLSVYQFETRRRRGVFRKFVSHRHDIVYIYVNEIPFQVDQGGSRKETSNDPLKPSIVKDKYRSERRTSFQ